LSVPPARPAPSPFSFQVANGSSCFFPLLASSFSRFSVGPGSPFFFPIPSDLFGERGRVLVPPFLPLSRLKAAPHQLFRVVFPFVPPLPILSIFLPGLFVPHPGPVPQIQHSDAAPRDFFAFPVVVLLPLISSLFRASPPALVLFCFFSPCPGPLLSLFQFMWIAFNHSLRSCPPRPRLSPVDPFSHPPFCLSAGPPPFPMPS